MVRILLPGCLVLSLVRGMEYEYQEVDPEELAGSSGGGTRLVGARAGNSMKEAPFIVAINTHGVREG